MSSPTATAPTLTWLAWAHQDGLPPLAGPAHTAERLLLLLHYGIDWNTSWVARYRPKYWDTLLPDRVLVATYRHATLPRWWSDLAADLTAAPRSSAERAELAALLSSPGLPVLEVMREEVQALTLRTRITAEAVRAHRPPPPREPPPATTDPRSTPPPATDSSEAQEKAS